jgi:opacity protein-like surface antigen
MHTKNGKTPAPITGRSRRLSSNFIFSTLILLSLCLESHAQAEHRFTVGGGAGVSPVVGDSGKRLDNGWHITVGGGYNFTSHLSTTIDYSYNGYGVSSRVLNEAQVPGANAHMWSVTANPKLSLTRLSNRFAPYVVGGVGYYRRTVEFTQPAVVPVFVFDPFFGVFFNTLVPADQVLGKISRGGAGGSLGGGFEIKLPKAGLKFYTEARYHYADTGRIPTRMVPVTFGVRW